MMNDSSLFVHNRESEQNAQWAGGALIQQPRADKISWLIRFIVGFNINVRLILDDIKGWVGEA